MATNWQTFPIEFKGGLISNMSPLQQGINAIGSATILQNFEPARSGGYAKLRGYNKADSAEVPGTGRVIGVKVVNDAEFIAARSNGSVTEYHRSTGAGWTSLGTAAVLGEKVRSEDFNFGTGHFVFFVDGVNYPALYDDTLNTLSFISSNPDLEGVEQVAVFKNTVFFSKGSNLYFRPLVMRKIIAQLMAAVLLTLATLSQVLFRFVTSLSSLAVTTFSVLLALVSQTSN